MFNAKPSSLVHIAIVTAITLAPTGYTAAGCEPVQISDWTAVGDANWQFSDDQVTANLGKGFLVSTKRYADFSLSLDFKPGPNTNSGVFIRCTDHSNISDTSCYEANIFDLRPDPSYRTGSIVNVSPPLAYIQTEGHWNTYEILAQRKHLVVKLNGMVTVDTYDDRLTEGPIALQFAGGEVTFRSIKLHSGAGVVP